MLGVVAFFVGLICSLFVSGATLVERLMVASMCGAMVFTAAVLLCARDYLRHRMLVRRVRRMLLRRQDVGDDGFAASFPGTDRALIREVRQAVATFFGVPTGKIHPTDDLRADLKVDRLEPNFHTFVFFRIFAIRQVSPRSFAYHSRNVVSLGDLTKEIERVLSEFSSSPPQPE